MQPESNDIRMKPKNRLQRRRQEKHVRKDKAQVTSPVAAAHLKLAKADQLRKTGKLKQAQAICQGLLEKHPDYVGALHTLGLICMETDNYWAALSYFVRAAMLNPKDWTILVNLANVYLGLGAQDMAAHSLEQARVLKHDDPNIQFTLGQVYEAQQEYELAAECFEEALALDPDYPGAAHILGGCCGHLGQVERAAASLKRALKSPQTTMHRLQVLYLLSQLPASVIDIDLLDALQHAYATDDKKDPDFETRAGFIRGAALHRQGRHDEAWQNLVEANKGPNARYIDAYKKELESSQRSMESAKAGGFSIRKPSPETDTLPISLFILGPSRSGKTTMERLISHLDGVKRGYENRIVETAVRRTSQLCGLLTIDSLNSLPSGLDEKFSEIYVEELMARADATRAFTNTHPGRISNVGRLAQTVPNSRFIFVKRDLNDIVFRIFTKQYRANTNYYGYSIKNISNYVSWYYEMVDTWINTMPEICLTLSYEDMHTDPGETLNRAAEFCGLEVSGSKLPPLGDDTGCAEPYLTFLQHARSA